MSEAKQGIYEMSMAEYLALPALSSAGRSMRVLLLYPTPLTPQKTLPLPDILPTRAAFLQTYKHTERRRVRRNPPLRL